MRPLDGISVLDVTQMISGPFASMQLADLGADVVKIERPDGGELGRSNPPFVDGRSTYFASVNRNKRSVALDLSSRDGREAFLSLAAKADVVIENNPPGRMERFGLDYESVRERNPEVVYCSISGFGQDGPYRELPALDLVAQAMSGSMSITGPADDQPYRAGLPIGDLTAAMFAVQSVVLALFRRERTGQGDWIDVSMLDCLASWLTVRAGHSFGTGRPYQRMGNAVDEFVPYGTYETAEGYLAVAVVADHQWRRLCRALDLEGYAEDDRFATLEARREHRETVDAVLEAAFESASATVWFDRLRGAGVPIAPVYDTLEVWEDEQVRSRGLLTTVRDGDREAKAIRHPVAFEGFDPEIREDVPDLGEHTREALVDVGFPEADVDALVASIEPPDTTPE